VSDLQPGLEGDASVEVTDAVAASSVGSGTVAVLATPEVAALVERAAVAALEGVLDDGRTSVGSRLELDHLAPTPVGGRATARVRLETVEGRRLEFAFEVTDGSGTVARGRHVRVVIDAERFMAAARERLGG
jgi:fluoroacetyl-CoA thioesterase